jgi:hypothetical protein
MVSYLGSCFLGIIVGVIVLAALALFIYTIMKARRMSRRIYIEPPVGSEDRDDEEAGRELEESPS